MGGLLDGVGIGGVELQFCLDPGRAQKLHVDALIELAAPCVAEFHYFVAAVRKFFQRFEELSNKQYVMLLQWFVMRGRKNMATAAMLFWQFSKYVRRIFFRRVPCFLPVVFSDNFCA